jgi:toxin ParE1/3/4
MPEARLRLKWAPAARQDLSEIWRYYDQSASREVADRLVRRIEEAGRSASKHPFQRRPRNDIRVGLRAVIISPYALFDRVGENEVEVVRVLHQRRDLPAILKDEGSQAER